MRVKHACAARVSRGAPAREGEADRFVAEGFAHETPPPGLVAFVEEQIERGEHAVEPRRQFAGTGTAKGSARSRMSCRARTSRFAMAASLVRTPPRSPQDSIRARCARRARVCASMESCG